MARSIGLKQDSMVYKVRVYEVNATTWERVGKYYECGPYDTKGTAASVGGGFTNHRNAWALRDEKRTGVKLGRTWIYDVVAGRLVWHEGDK